MSFSFRARAIDAAALGVPAEDVLRLVRPAQSLQVLKSTHEAYSPQAANGDLDLVRMLPRRSSNQARPAASWRRGILPDGAESDKLPERATGTLQEAVGVMGKVKPDCRPAVFGRRMLTFRFQKWYLGVANKLRETLAPLLPFQPNAADCRLRDPSVGDWPFPLTKGCIGPASLGKCATVVVTWSS